MWIKYRYLHSSGNWLQLRLYNVAPIKLPPLQPRRRQNSSPTILLIPPPKFSKFHPASSSFIYIFLFFLPCHCIAFYIPPESYFNMVRGRATARGSRRGAATGGTERPSGDVPASASTSTDTPAAVSSEAAPARGGATRATRAPAVARFRPKNVRRDEADRDSLARQEEKKASERAAEERRARGRSRFRSKRSRGDTMGRGGFGRIISGASGPFSSGIGG